MSESRPPVDDEPEDAGGVRHPPDGRRDRGPDPLLGPNLVDAPARAHAVDPSKNVVLEASAGTGKTRVLVERYVNLLRAGVEPDHILAITFTRKAAAEMRQRIIERLKEASRLSQFDAARWRELRDRLGEIAISTIDAFCLSLLREFPLEADVDPGFDLADSTEVPRLMNESLDQALRICRAVAKDDEDVALVFVQLGERRLRTGLSALLDRRLVAPQALGRFLAKGPRDLTVATACASGAARLRDVCARVPGGIDRFLADGPRRRPQFVMLAHDLRRLAEPAAVAESGLEAQTFRALVDRIGGYFLTQEGKPRGGRFAGTGFTAADSDGADAWRRHRACAAEIAPDVARAIRDFRRDLNAVMARGVWRIFAVALRQYQRTLDAHGLLDFSGVLERAVKLLRDLDEFAESRLRLESRHRHVLVDEFQDTSRAQWDLVRQLVRSWGEGAGASADAFPPSIFIVGDRKQSIYGFRDADVSIVDDAALFVEGLRPEGQSRQAITVSFRAVPELLAFVNAVFAEVAGGAPPSRRDAFRFDQQDRFPVASDTAVLRSFAGPLDTQPSLDSAGDRHAPVDDAGGDGPVGFIAAETVQATAEQVAGEVVRVLSGVAVRDRDTGIRRPAQAADVAILFRSRDHHREFEAALDRRGVATYVYKGLGFFDGDEIQDAVALLRYLADPMSPLRAAALLRSRVVRLSDPAVARIGSQSAEAILGADPSLVLAALGEEDRRVLTRLRGAVPRWLASVDRLTAAEVFDAVMRESAYAYEIRGARRRQARENLKKLRGMIRRAENRGYTTLARIADQLDRLAVGDESNAAIDAVDAVSLMTVHAAKGLEFPIVFVVNMDRGTGGARAPIRVTEDASGDPSVAIADYQSEADEDAQAREREEGKRLLYVALTRARDRLYLSATVKNGVCRVGRGSLGEILPASIKARLVSAAARDVRPDEQRLTTTREALAWIDDFDAPEA